MLFAVNVGNTNLSMGCMEKEKIIFTARISTDRSKTTDEYALILNGIFTMHGISPSEVEGAIIVCVVPQLRTIVSHAVERLTGKRPMIVGAGLKTGLNIKIDNPGQLGSDLAVGAVAASAKYKKPVIVFDMGTAMTMSVIDENSAYLGCMIMPGVRLAVDALSAGTSQLPYIELSAPTQMIGKNTVDSMKSGVIFGTAAMIDGLIERTEQILGQTATVVASGELISSILPHCQHNILFDEYLTLYGMQLLYHKNKKTIGTASKEEAMKV